MLEEGWIDNTYLAQRTDGLAQLRDGLAWFTPERVADLSSVRAEALWEAARC